MSAECALCSLNEAIAVCATGRSRDSLRSVLTIWSVGPDPQKFSASAIRSDSPSRRRRGSSISASSSNSFGICTELKRQRDTLKINLRMKKREENRRMTSAVQNGIQSRTDTDLCESVQSAEQVPLRCARRLDQFEEEVFFLQLHEPAEFH